MARKPLIFLDFSKSYNYTPTIANGKTIPVKLDYFKNFLKTLYINVTNNTNMATNRK